MALPSGLEVADHGTQGWNAIYSANFELIDERFVEAMLATKVMGADAVDDPDVLQSSTLGDTTTGTPGSSVRKINGTGDDDDINDNFSTLTRQVNFLIAENVSLRAQLVSLLTALRKTGGTGVIADSPP